MIDLVANLHRREWSKPLDHHCKQHVASSDHGQIGLLLGKQSIAGAITPVGDGGARASGRDAAPLAGDVVLETVRCIAGDPPTRSGRKPSTCPHNWMLGTCHNDRLLLGQNRFNQIGDGKGKPYNELDWLWL